MCACGLFASSFYELALGSVLIRNGTLLFTVYCAIITAILSTTNTHLH